MMSFFLEKDLLTTKAMPDKFDLSSPVTGNQETIVTKIEYISFYRLMKMADESNQQISIRVFSDVCWGCYSEPTFNEYQKDKNYTWKILLSWVYSSLSLVGKKANLWFWVLKWAIDIHLLLHRMPKRWSNGSLCRYIVFHWWLCFSNAGSNWPMWQT